MLRAVVSYWRKYVHKVLVNRLGGLSLPRKSVVRLTDRPDMTLDVYCGRKTTMQQQQQNLISWKIVICTDSKENTCAVLTAPLRMFYIFHLEHIQLGVPVLHSSQRLLFI